MNLGFNADGRKLSRREARIVLAEVQLRDGPGCQNAHEHPHQDGHPCKGQLVVHHIDNNPRNNPPDGSNWRCACHGHNTRMHPRGRSRYHKVLQGKERIALSNTMRERIERGRAEVTRVSGELQKSETIRPIVENWILEDIRRNGKLETSEAINSCSYVAKCVQSTVKKIIDGMKSKAGPLETLFENDEEGTSREYLRMKNKPER